MIAMSKTCCMSAASTSAMKRSGSGGTGLVRCLRLRSAGGVFSTCAPFRDVGMRCDGFERVTLGFGPMVAQLKFQLESGGSYFSFGGGF